MEKIIYVLGGFIISTTAFFLILNSSYHNLFKESMIFNQEEDVVLNDTVLDVENIKTLPANAFGHLGQQEDASEGSVQAVNSEIAISSKTDELSLARPQSGGGLGGGDPMTSEQIKYKYVYKGGVIDPIQSQVKVFRKRHDIDFAEDFNNLISNTDLGVIDLTQFSSPTLRSLSLKQDISLGYDINIDFDQGSIAVNSNNQGWMPSEMLTCSTHDCYKKYQLKITDLPENEQIIAIADNFIKSKKINTSQYSTPRIDNSWKQEFEERESKTDIYIPEIISVIYPLLIDNKEVKNMNGGEYGMRVNVNIRQNKVSGLYGLSMYNFENSAYEAETDTKKILRIVENGGVNYMSYDENAEEIEVEVGDPVFNYISYMHQQNVRYEELMIPALIFPIIKKPKSKYFYRKNIVIPLTKDILDEYQGNEFIVTMKEIVEDFDSDFNGIINDFNDCIKAGNPAMESYPRQCLVNEEVFTENIGNELEKNDLIRINTPRPNQKITNPLVIEGEAKGNWFFEGDFPVVLTDWDGLIIAEGFASANGVWMTDEFVKFEAELEFEKPEYKNNGTLILRKDNPSGLLEHDDALEIPIYFLK